MANTSQKKRNNQFRYARFKDNGPISALYRMGHVNASFGLVNAYQETVRLPIRVSPKNCVLERQFGVVISGIRLEMLMLKSAPAI